MSTSPHITKRTGLKQGQLMYYLHYQPSFYHLHVHIINVNVGILTLANV
jgi:hypothetical protein